MNRTDHAARPRLDFHGRLIEGRQLRVGFIGCGSHAYRNIYPTLQFAPVQLVATCDLDVDRARAFAATFGAEAAYADHGRLLERDDLDAVFVVTSSDDRGRPRYPDLAIDCLDAGCHVWIEKPPATTCRDVDRMREAASRNDRFVMVGFKKMFAPANEKALALSRLDEFGPISLVRLEYPQRIPTTAEMARFLDDQQAVPGAVAFLDHVCHPMSLLVMLLGMPDALFYERSRNGSGIALCTFEHGAVAELALTWGGGTTDGLERSVIYSDTGRHITVDNNTTVSYHRMPFPGYGDVPDFYGAATEDATAVWRPEFSLGQLYNKGSFLLGYYNEINEFAVAALADRSPAKGTLEHAWQVTRLFEAFSEPPGTTIRLGDDVSQRA